MDDEQYINIEDGLSVGAMKIANKYEIFSEEEVDAINNKIPELDKRVGVIDNEIKEINSSLENIKNEIENIEPDTGCVYNAKSLKQIYSKNIKAIAFGDSICHGTGSDNGGAYGFIQMTQNTLSAINCPNYYKRLVNMASLTTNWTSTNEGISNLLKYTTTGDIKLGETGSPAKPPINYVFNVVYSTRPDGGTCEVYKNDVLVDNINCNGPSKDGLISSYNCNANEKCYIKTIEGQKFYLNDIYSYANLDRGHRLSYYAVGGSKTSDYSKQVFLDALEGFGGNLLVWEYLANDYGQNNYDNYVAWTTEVITKAKELNMDVIITITCGQNGTETTGKVNWDKFKDFIYNIAKTLNCCVVDYDKLFGGYTKAKTNGLIVDTVHPSTPGYLLMANELCNILVGRNCLEYEGLSLELGDYREKGFGYIKENTLYNLENLKSRYINIKVGNAWDYYNYLKPSVSYISNSGRHPAEIPTGNFTLDNARSKRVMCNTGNGSWGKTNMEYVYSLPQMETITELPSLSDDNIGKMWIYNNKVITYIKELGYVELNITSLS